MREGEIDFVVVRKPIVLVVLEIVLGEWMSEREEWMRCGTD